MFAIYIHPLVIALICAGAAWYHLACIEPGLWARRARPAAFLIAAVLSAVAIGSFALLPILPGRVVVAICVVYLAFVAAPGFVMWLTRGSRPLEGDRALAARLIQLSLDAAAVGDARQWQEMMRALGRIDDPEAALFAGAARGYADEAAAGAPARADTIARFRDEGQAYLVGRRKKHRIANSLAIALAALIGFIPAIVIARPIACQDAEDLLGSERRMLTTADPRAEPKGPSLLAPSLVFTPVGSGALNMLEAAGSRYDPNTLDQLRDAGFLQAYWAMWVRESGTKLGADLFVFAHQKGALDYQQAVTRYACRYATEAFPVPGGGVGLRIRYGSGDPIRDQAAWVVGPARMVIAIGYTVAPADHRELLDLVEQLH